MSLRRRDEKSKIDPTYDDGTGTYFTLKLHCGGKFVHLPTAMYDGGNVYVYDYVKFGDLSLLYVDALCDLAGLLGFKRYYMIKEGGFVLLSNDRTLHGNCKESGLTVDMYVEADVDVLIESQMASSNGVKLNGDKSKHNAKFPSHSYEDEEEDSGEAGVANDGMVNEDTNDEGNENLDDAENEELNAPELNNEQESEDESDSPSIDLGESDQELHSLHGSDEEDDSTVIQNIFNPKRDMQEPSFQCGMKFTTLKEFQEAVRNFSIKKGRPIKFCKSEKFRCRAKCRKVGCKWMIYAAVLNGKDKAEVRSYYPHHNCSFSYRNPNVKSSWLAKKYLKDFIHDPKANMTNFRKRMVLETRCHISKSTAYRARKKAFEMVRGTEEDQYALIWDYMEEIKRTDSGATIELRTGVQTTGEVDPETQEILLGENVPTIIDIPRFQRLYCCLSAPKHGMQSGCRPIFGIDGCHLKHRYGGVLLVAVGVDPNNSLYPFAYAVVQSETKDSWTWFLDLVRVDLGIVSDHEWTIVSDKQKGLIQACDLVFPSADHRFCVRHLHANWATAGFTGMELKNALYGAACASTVQEFEKAMKHLAEIDKNAAEWLKEKPPSQWSRSHFNVRPKCDILLNNICESFNSVILDARQLPILSMFEWIRSYLMVRFQENRERVMTHLQGKKICPNIKKKLMKNMECSGECIPQRADTNKYECHTLNGDQFVVDLYEKTCSCRRWQLTGIPCSHACAAIGMTIHDPEDYVHGCYKVTTYLNVYSMTVQPVSGLKQLRETGHEPVIPPLIKKPPGRPKKARRKSKGEVSISQNTKGKQKLRRTGLSCVCSHCKKGGHNKRTCPELIGSATETAFEPVSSNKPVSDIASGSRKRKDKTTTQGPPKAGRKGKIVRTNGNTVTQGSPIDMSQSVPTYKATTVGNNTGPTTAPLSQSMEASPSAATLDNHGTASASKSFPYYRTVKDNPNPIPNFIVRDGKRYLPRSLIPAAMAVSKKASKKATK